MNTNGDTMGGPGIASRYTGSSVRRKEDARILTGRGEYVDDITMPGMAHAAFARSPLAHARVAGVDTSEASGVEGVVAVFTGEDLERLLTPGPYGQAERVEAMYGFSYPRHTCLATDKVRLVGDPVALVIAESRQLAEDAADMIQVDYEELPPVTTGEQALDPASTPVFDDLGSNVVLRDRHTYGDVDGVFARADRVMRAPIRLHRHQNVPMETRGCVASYDGGTGRLLVWSANQSVGLQRDSLAARLGMDPERIRVRAADVGGSFGLKIAASREDVAVAAASIATGRPVKYIEDRYEHLIAAGQAREESFDVEVAYSDDGDILGLRVKMVIDTGAYPGIGAGLPYYIEAMLPGPYKLEALDFEFASVVTNKATYVSYRGPWAAETFLRERVIDLVARDLGKEPTEVRRRNLVRRRDQPASMITGRSLRGITAAEALDKVAGELDVAGFRRRQLEARSNGRYIGIGIASYIEAAPGPRSGSSPLGAERMQMYVDGDGTVVAVTGQMPHGQGHETTLAQIVADQLGVRIEEVKVVFGDSDLGPKSLTGGSRAATMAGGAALTTARSLRQRILEAAARVFEADPADLVIDAGSIAVAGVPSRSMTFSELVRALAATVPGAGGEPGPAELEVDETFDGGEGGWSGGAHGVVVEVDIETGLVSFERYVVAEDCGDLINPAVVDGQIRGGVAQGIGAVLLEHSAYDRDGNCLSATFMDYLLPTAMDIPRIEIFYLEPDRTDPLVNFRGVGEGGMIVAPAAVCNAIEDALAPFGVRVHDQHLPPGKLLELAGVIGA